MLAQGVAGGERDSVTSQWGEKVKWEVLNLVVGGRGGGFAYVWYVCVSEFSYIHYLPPPCYKHLEKLYSFYHLALSVIVEE